jgi:hypothetical protein
VWSPSLPPDSPTRRERYAKFKEKRRMCSLVSSLPQQSPPARKGCLVWFQDAPLQARHLRTQQAEVTPTSSNSQRRQVCRPRLRDAVSTVSPPERACLRPSQAFFFTWWCVQSMVGA